MPVAGVGVFGDFLAGRVGGGFDDRFVVAPVRVAALVGGEVFVAVRLLEAEVDAPDEVGGEAAQQDDGQLRQAGPEREVPAAAEASLIGAPAVRAKAKQALMMPEKVATRMPFLKLNSAMAFFFSSAGISFSLVKPAMPRSRCRPDRRAPQEGDEAGGAGRDFR